MSFSKISPFSLLQPFAVIAAHGPVSQPRFTNTGRRASIYLLWKRDESVSDDDERSHSMSQQ